MYYSNNNNNSKIKIFGSHIVTHSHLVVLVLAVVSSRIGMKFGRSVLQVNTLQLTEYGVIVSRCWP